MAENNSLWQKVYDATWQGKLWGKNGAIHWSRARCLYLESIGKKAEASSAMSSTYYTAAGHAFARAKLASFLPKIFWMAVGLWYLVWALSHSNRVERILGIEKMTHGQLDVRASILAKWGRYKKALRCLEEALSRPDITNDSRALILVKRGEVLYALHKLPLAAEAYIRASKIKGIKATTEVRVLKSLGQHYKRLGNKKFAQENLEKALTLAEKNNLGDQVVKIKALMKKL